VNVITAIPEPRHPPAARNQITQTRKSAMPYDSDL
jgi:hypothetical protein